MKILYVENHAVFARQVIEQFLSQWQVTLVPSLSSARGQFARSTYDAVLIDYDLDDGKGDALVRELRDCGYKGRIIAVSAHDRGNEALIRAGANEVYGKLSFSRIGQILAT